MIVKRPSSAVSGKVLTGLDQVDKAAKSGSLPVGLKKNGLVFKGVVDLTDFAATDNGGPGKLDGWLKLILDLALRLQICTCTLKRLHKISQNVGRVDLSGFTRLCILHHQLTLILLLLKVTNNDSWTIYG